VLFDKIATIHFVCEKYINILALEMASQGNQHCASCIGTLSFAVPGRAFQFRQKSFNSIRFSLPNRFFRLDSIRQSDKFAASTLIFK